MVSQTVITVGVVYGWFAAFSALCSGLVVITGLLFPKQIMSPSKPFSHIVFLISLCNLLSSIGASLGLPSDGTMRCRAQAFLLLFFYPASWIWTSLLVYQIRSLLVYRRLWLKPLQMHIICWTIVCLISFIPLSTNAYGQDDALNQQIPCNFQGNSEIAFYWSLATFGCILVACILVMMVCMGHVLYHWAYYGQTDKTGKEYAIFRTTRGYPLFMLLCWIPYLGLYVFDPSMHLSYPGINAFILILSTQYGTFLTIFFFLFCRAGSRQWRRFLGLKALPDDTIKESSHSTAIIADTRSIRKISSTVGPTTSQHDMSSTATVQPNSNDSMNDTGDGDDFDDERLLYICCVDDGTDIVVGTTMNEVFRVSDDFGKSSEFDANPWTRESDSGL